MQLTDNSYHMDLKPDNILILDSPSPDSTPRFKIADFGFSVTSPNDALKGGTGSYGQ